MITAYPRHMRYVLALACLAACGADARYRGPDGAIVGVPWRCKDGTYVGTWIDPHRGSELKACPMTLSITCPDPAGGTREYMVASDSVLALADEPPMAIGLAANTALCERIRRAGD